MPKDKKQGNKSKKSEIDYKELAEQLAVENAQLNEAMLRERADAMNVRKRADEERLKMAGFHKANVVRELLPIIDNFERAHKSQESRAMSHEELQKGVAALNKQFNQILEKLGVDRIKTVGEHFDPHTMEAVSMEEGDGKHEIVSEELQSGYVINDEVLRHAMVRVKG